MLRQGVVLHVEQVREQTRYLRRAFLTLPPPKIPKLARSLVVVLNSA